MLATSAKRVTLFCESHITKQFTPDKCCNIYAWLVGAGRPFGERWRIVSEWPAIRPRVHSLAKRGFSSTTRLLAFEGKLPALNSRRTLISEQDPRSVNQILFIAKPLDQFVGKWTDFGLQIVGQVAIDVSSCVRR